jgi:Flp pilus assembly protein TadB
MRKVIVLALCILFNFSAFAVNTSPETAAAQQKLESIVNGSYKVQNAKEQKAIDKFKSKFEKAVKKVKDAKAKRAGDLGGLLVTIGIILIIIGLVGIVLGALGILPWATGGSALFLGLILWLIGKYAF